MKTVFVIAISLTACTLAWDFQSEMRKSSGESGLAIGYVPGSGMRVLPLDGSSTTSENLENYSGPCRACPGWFSSDGQLITWEQVPVNWVPGQAGFIVKTITGEPVATWIGKAIDVYALALSPDRSKIAFEAWDHYSQQPNMGLQYVVLGGSERVILMPQPSKEDATGSESLGWSPDSRSIVFSRHGKVITMDLNTRKTNEIADGTTPAWSPDGRWIAFTSADKRPMLIDPLNHRLLALWGGKKITGPMAWSPDSCCLSFSAHTNDVASLIYSGGRIVVYNVRDGEWFALAGFVLGEGSSARYGWFYHWREFLTHNVPN